MKTLAVFSIIYAVLISSLAFGAACDPVSLAICENNLTYSASLSNNLSYNVLQLNKTLSDTIAERDYYKSLYENSSIGNVTIGDFLNLNSSVRNLSIRVEQNFYNVSQTLNNFEENQRNLIIEINIAVALTLIGVSIYLFKKLFSVYRGHHGIQHEKKSDQTA